MSRAVPYRPDLQAATSSSYDGDGFLGVGVDGDGSPKGVAIPPVEATPPLGLFARPIDPGQGTPGNPLAGASCTILRLTGDNDDFAIPLTDPRVQGLVPQLAKGGVVLYEPTNQNADGSLVTDLARVSVNDDGSHRVVIHAPAATPPTKVVVEIADGPTMTFDGAAQSITLALPGGGPSIVLDATNGAQVGGPGGVPIALAEPAFVAWLTEVGAATMLGPPPGFAASKAKAT